MSEMTHHMLPRLQTVVWRHRICKQKRCFNNVTVSCKLNNGPAIHLWEMLWFFFIQIRTICLSGTSLSLVCQSNKIMLLELMLSLCHGTFSYYYITINYDSDCSAADHLWFLSNPHSDSWHMSMKINQNAECWLQKPYLPASHLSWCRRVMCSVLLVCLSISWISQKCFMFVKC